MTNYAIEIHEISKVYRITPGGTGGGRTLQEDLVRLVKSPFQSKRERARKYDEVWALEDVSFNVEDGEVIGLIGRNGAGKSTLLKVLSRITEPTSGYADLYGRVGALLEVGTGFHTELTGRENVFLSGSILGMSRAEIRSKFDQIVDFAGVEKYIDTPVKRYSSGMQVRLAFAVAAHLEPEILLVDEVLAVGDAAFQKKSLGKMDEVAQAGRTVVFVSHNMGAITQLCSRAVWLDNGQVAADGPVDEVVSSYLTEVSERGEWRTDITQRTDRQGDGRLRFTGFRIQDSHGNPITSIVAGDPVDLLLSYKKNPGVQGVTTIWFWIIDAFGNRLITLSTRYNGEDFIDLPDEGEIVLHFDKFPLRGGKYYAQLGADIDGHKADRLDRALSLDVIHGAFYSVGYPNHPRDGDVMVEHSWDVRS